MFFQGTESLLRGNAATVRSKGKLSFCTGVVFNTLPARLSRKPLSSCSVLGDIQLFSYSQPQHSPPHYSLFALEDWRNPIRQHFWKLQHLDPEPSILQDALAMGLNRKKELCLKEKGKNITFTFKAQNVPHQWRNCWALVLISLENSACSCLCPSVVVSHRNCPATILFMKGKCTSHFHEVMKTLSQYQVLFLFFP